MIIINSISQLGTKSDVVVDKLRQYLEERAADAQLAFGRIEFNKEPGGKAIVIRGDGKDKKFIYSNRLNFIPLKPGDKRITESGKNYLQSRRLTEVQYVEMLKLFSIYLDYIGIECDIFIQEYEDDSKSTICIRKGKESLHKEWLKPNNFTQEKL